MLSYSSSLSICGRPGKLPPIYPPLPLNHSPFHGVWQAWRLAIVAFRCGCCRARFTTFEALHVRYNQAKTFLKHLGCLKLIHLLSSSLANSFYSRRRSLNGLITIVVVRPLENTINGAPQAYLTVWPTFLPIWPQCLAVWLPSLDVWLSPGLKTKQGQKKKTSANLFLLKTVKTEKTRQLRYKIWFLKLGEKETS
jgi:hypothetical protein